MKLTKEHTSQEDAIEKYFCPLLADKNTTELTNEQAQVFMSVAMSNVMGTPVPIPTGKKLKTLPFEAQVLIKRVEVCFDYKITDLGVILLLVFLSHSLGSVIMYLTMIQWYCKKNSIEVFGINEFSKMFPMGVYSEEDLHAAWDAQKVPDSPDNLIDHPTALTSLRY